MSNWFERALEMKEEGRDMMDIAEELGLHYDTVRKKFKKHYTQDKSIPNPFPTPNRLIDEVLAFAKKGATLEQIADKMDIMIDDVLSVLDTLMNKGYQIHISPDDYVTLSTLPLPTDNRVKELWDGSKTFKFGVVSDTHLCSKNQQLTFLNKVYDIFEAEGVSRVLHCGDITEGYGMRKGHEYEVFKHGADAQIKYVVDNYPSRPSFDTEFITGNHDHSFIKSAGLDIGIAIAKERKDMKYLGRSFARINITDNCCLDIVHPTDGGSYALSYATQKYIEAIPEYDMPDILLCGHHHKYINFFYRGVHTCEVPTTQARTDWMRNNRLVAYVGAMILTITVDKDGFISRFVPEFIPCKHILKEDY